MTSVRRQLLWTLPPAVLVLLALALFAILREVRDEISELYDAELAQAVTATLPHSPHAAAAVEGSDDPREALVVARRSSRTQEVTYTPAGSVEFPPAERLGFSNAVVNNETWRLYTGRAGEDLVQAGQPLRIRNEAVAGIITRAALPLALLVPAIILTVLLLVRRALKPLAHFERELHARQPDALSSLEVQALPLELLPMATAMNALLERLSRALQLQEVFVSNAAHELLTPLAALQIQVQVLERAKSEERRERATRDVRASLERCVGLARQLLTLARHSGEQHGRPFQPVSLSSAVRAAVAAVLVRAHARAIDLGVTSEVDRLVEGDEKALHILLENLLENAVKYSPDGGRVDVNLTLSAGQAAITVSDNGPGIAPSDAPHVFDRFYRSTNTDVEGSGLGLAISREIARRHGASIELNTPGRLGGLDVTVRFQDASRDGSR